MTHREFGRERAEVARAARDVTTVADARAIQERMRSLVVEQPLVRPPRLIAGVDVSFDRFSPWLHAGVIVIDAETREVVASAAITERAAFPYVPGYLSFREAPPVLTAWSRLDVQPDLLIVDGQGIAHPRRCGIACHLGILLDIPSIGCAKSRLTGTYEEPGPEPGESSPLLDGETRIGTVIRTRRRARPLFISIGDRVTLEESVRQVVDLCEGYRQPLTTRLAHELVNDERRKRKEE